MPPSKKEPIRDEKVPNSWGLIEQVSSRPWNKDDVKKILGRPSSIFERKGKDDEFWTFDDSKTEYQRFSIHFSKDNFVSIVVYIPQEYERNIFSIDSILERWKTFHCVEKSEQRLSPGLIKVVHYFGCDDGRKFFFNKWNEVLSIDIPILKTQKKTL
ncbi:MAG: hypothetical protein WCG27_09920 [Pseudomonadota bacterium]